MKKLELSYSEELLIDILRNFEFLRNYGYHPVEIAYWTRAYPSVYFENYSLKQRLSVIGSDLDTNSKYTICIEKRRVFSYKVLTVNKIYSLFENERIKDENYTLKLQAEFIQQHLIPIIKGDMWIDELIKDREQ